jgi:hypothetical protein
MASPSGTAGRHSLIPGVPHRSHTRTTTASATSEHVVTDVPNGDESKTDDDVEGEDAMPFLLLAIVMIDR